MDFNALMNISLWHGLCMALLVIVSVFGFVYPVIMIVRSEIVNKNRQDRTIQLELFFCEVALCGFMLAMSLVFVVFNGLIDISLWHGLFAVLLMIASGFGFVYPGIMMGRSETTNKNRQDRTIQLESSLCRGIAIFGFAPAIFLLCYPF